jgi:hypothetical protein
MNKVRFSFIYMVIAVGLWHSNTNGLSSLAKNDPYPIFSTSYPYEELLAATKNHLKGFECDYNPDHVSFALSAFYQKSSSGRNYDKKKVHLGDLEGRWHMLGMLYGPVPGVGALPETLVGTRLGEAKEAIFDTASDNQVPNDDVLVDCSHQLGYFSVPIKYRKQGARFEAAFQMCEDFGLLIQGGFADIKQTLTNFENLYCSYKPECTDAQFDPAGEATSITCDDATNYCLPHGFTTENVLLINDLLMSCSSANRIFQEQGITCSCKNTENLCDFHEISFEDIRFSFWLRHIFDCNEEFSCEWPKFLFIPFIYLEGSYPGSKRRNRHDFLAAPFGNDGHPSVGFTGGFHIDFIETVEISFHGGMTHFFARDVKDFRLPTHATQSGVFPFATNVKLQPGRNYHATGALHAYRFVDKLSAHIEFTYVNHDEDSITLKNQAFKDIFRVKQQECLSKFDVCLLTTAGNYEISPYLSLGFAVQWPLAQRNAYRSTTFIGTIQGVF